MLTGFNKYKMIVKRMKSLEIEIIEMMKRCQHITKLQSELIQKTKFIDFKLDEAIAKHCYLEKTNYELPPQVVTPKFHLMWNLQKLTKLQTQHFTQQHYIT